MKKERTITIIIFIVLGALVLVFLGTRFFDELLLKKPEIISPPEKKSELQIRELKGKLLEDAEPMIGGASLLVIESKEEGLYGDPRFKIQYQQEFDLFLIGLYDIPLSKVREEAEQSFLEKADGKLDILCQLNVLVSSPYSVRGDEIIENRESLNICLRR